MLAIWMAGKLLGIEGRRAAGEDPFAIAQVRYARGEISQEEYQRLRQELRA